VTTSLNVIAVCRRLAGAVRAPSPVIHSFSDRAPCGSLSTQVSDGQTHTHIHTHTHTYTHTHTHTNTNLWQFSAGVMLLPVPDSDSFIHIRYWCHQITVISYHTHTCVNIKYDDPDDKINHTVFHIVEKGIQTAICVPNDVLVSDLSYKQHLLYIFVSIFLSKCFKPTYMSSAYWEIV